METRSYRFWSRYSRELLYEPVKKGITISAGNTLVILFLIFGGIVPQAKQISESRKLIKERKEVAVQTQERLDGISAARPIIEGSEATFATLNALVPKEIGLADLLSLLSVKTSQHLFQLTYLAPASEVPASQPNFKELLIRIDAKGSQQNVLALIEDLESGERFVGIKSVRIENLPRESFGNARLNLAVYSHE